MIDLHTHILPGLDDGAASLEEAVEMARLAVTDGVHTMVATPHNLEWGPEIGKSLVDARVSEVWAALQRAGVGLNLVAGVEAYLTPDLPRQVDGQEAFCLGDTPYILVELPLYQYPAYTEQVVFELQVRGLIPILAHPERNTVLVEEPQRLYGLVERGLITQLTAASLLGHFGRYVQEAAFLFLEHNLSHIIASDSHGPQRRPPVLSAAVAAAGNIVGQERARAMVTCIPEAILSGRRFPWPAPIPLKPKRKLFFRREAL